MSSNTKEQTIDGYITEYSNSHNVSPMKSIQTAMAKEFIEYADERDSSKTKKGD